MSVAEFNTDLGPRLRLTAELSTVEGVAKLHDWVNEIVIGNKETRFSGPFGHNLELIWEVRPAPSKFKNPRNVLFAVANAMPDEPRKFKLRVFWQPLFAEVGSEIDLDSVSAFAKHICKYLMMSYHHKEGRD